MLLFYTARTENQEATATDSIGGYISCTSIPNDLSNNLFVDDVIGEINQIQTRGIVLKNTLTRAVKNVVLFLKNDTPDEIKVAAVSLSPGYKMERLNSPNQLPQIGEFYKTDSQFASTYIKVKSKNQGSFQEYISIDGEDILFPEARQYSIEEIRNRIYEALRYSTEYSVAKEGEDTIILTYNTLGLVDRQISYTTNSVQLEIPPFSGAIDNSILLVTSLEPEEGIGIWISKKSIIQEKSCKDLFEEYSKVRRFDDIDNQGIIDNSNNPAEIRSFDLVIDFE